MRLYVSLCLVVVCLSEVRAKLKGDDCEGFLNKFNRKLQDRDVLGDLNIDQMELELMKACKEARGKDERFCYYIGATDISATKLVREVARPLSFSKPTEKICEDLKKKDGQICELRYEKQIDLESVDLKKLKVKELKKILSNWGEDCRGCAEKSDYVSKINSVKHMHVEL